MRSITVTKTLCGLVLVISIILLPTILSVTASDEATVTEIDWPALVPKDWNPNQRFNPLSQGQIDQLLNTDPEEAEKLLSEMDDFNTAAPVVKELDGKLVKLPGYVVPLEFNSTSVSEFLLVPYVGACVHVPPPPANQVIYSKTEKEVAIEGLFAPVWVTGTLSTSSVSSELADAGYTMEVHQVEPYEW